MFVCPLLNHRLCSPSGGAVLWLAVYPHSSNAVCHLQARCLIFLCPPAELKALDRQVLQLSKEVCDLQAQRQCAVARLRNSIALGVLDSMQAMDITRAPSLLEWFPTTMVTLQRHEAIVLQQVVGEYVQTCCRWLANLFHSSHRHYVIE